MSIVFGPDDRLSAEYDKPMVHIIRERRRPETDEWDKEPVIVIHEERIGDLCATLAQQYDLFIDRKMETAKKR